MGWFEDHSKIQDPVSRCQGQSASARQPSSERHFPVISPGSPAAQRWHTHGQWPLPDQSSITVPNCSENLPACSDTILTFDIHSNKRWSFTAQLNCCVKKFLLLDVLNLIRDHLIRRWLVLTLSSHAPSPSRSSRHTSQSQPTSAIS